MRFRTKLAMASAAAALMAGAASAQTAPVTLTVNMTGNADIPAEVNLLESSDLAVQTGVVGITIDPADPDFNTTSGVSGLLRVEFDNATLQASVVPSNVMSFGGTGTPPPCQTVAGNVLVNSGGGIGQSFVVFEVPDIANCGDATAEGNLRVELPIGLTTLADANFSVGVTRGGGVTLVPTTAYAVSMGPLVEVGPRFDVAFSTTGAAMDLELDLGQTPPFSAFDPAGGPGMTGTAFTAQLGDFSITEVNNMTDLQGTIAAGTPASVDLTITANTSADGIAKFTVGPTDLTLVEGTNRFTGSVAMPATGPFPVSIELAGTTGVPASTPAQSFTPEAVVVTADTPAATIMQAATSEIAPVTRDGTTVSFSWVALEAGANVNRVMRITGLNPANPQRVLATVSGLNTNEATTPDLDITANLNVSGGGEAVISGSQLGGILQGLGEIDRSAPGITRGDVSITIEASDIDMKSQLITAGGGVSAGANLDSLEQ